MVFASSSITAICGCSIIFCENFLPRRFSAFIFTLKSEFKKFNYIIKKNFYLYEISIGLYIYIYVYAFFWNSKGKRCHENIFYFSRTPCAPASLYNRTHVHKIHPLVHTGVAVSRESYYAVVHPVEGTRRLHENISAVNCMRTRKFKIISEFLRYNIFSMLLEH